MTEAGSFEDFFYLDPLARRVRESHAAALFDQAVRLKKSSGVDSLGLYLEASHIAPAYVSAHVVAVQALLVRGSSGRAHALVVQAVRLDPENDVLWTRPARAVGL